MYKDMWKQLMCYMIPVIDHMFKGVIFSLQLNIGDNEVLMPDLVQIFLSL